MGTSKAVAAALLLAGSFAAQFNYTELMAGVSPNETRSVTFKPFPDDPEFGSTDWTWRVNITDLPAPNQETNYPVGGPKESSPSTRAITLTYDLTWPNGGLIRESLNSFTTRVPTICAAYPYTISRMPNITNNWPSNNTNNPDCAPLLGQSCFDAIIDKAKPTQAGNCEVERKWDKIPECASTFGYAFHEQRPKGWYGTLSAGLMSRVSGESFNNISYLYDGEGEEVYESAVNMLQVILVHATRLGGDVERRASLACMRVRSDTLEVMEGEVVVVIWMGMIVRGGEGVWIGGLWWEGWAWRWLWGWVCRLVCRN